MVKMRETGKTVPQGDGERLISRRLTMAFCLIAIVLAVLAEFF